MAQRLITYAEYIAFTDTLSGMIEVLLTALGDEDTPGSAAAEAAALRNSIVAFAAVDEAKITADLIDAAIALVTTVGQESMLASYCSGFNSAVTSHLGTDLNAWLTIGGLRVHNLYRRAGNTSLSPVNVFPPVTILGTFTVTGDGAGLFTADPITDGGVDTSMYADAQLEVKVIGQQLGASEIVMTVIGTDFAGAAQSHTATITTGAAKDAVFDVATAADRFATVTSITITGGINGDDLQIQTKEDRTL